MEIIAAKCKVLTAFKQFANTSNFVLRQVQPGDGDDEPPLDATALLAYYDCKTAEELHIAHCNASMKTADERDVYELALTRPHVYEDVCRVRKERKKLREAKKSVVYSLEGDNRLEPVEYLDDATEEAKNLSYDLYDPERGATTSVKECDVEKLYWKTHAQCIVGEGGAGKTLLHISKAKSYARRLGKDTIIVLQGSMEPLGVLSENGELEKAGAIVFSDIKLQNIRGSLDENEQKVLFDVRKGGSMYLARSGHNHIEPGERCHAGCDSTSRGGWPGDQDLPGAIQTEPGS